MEKHQLYYEYWYETFMSTYISGECTFYGGWCLSNTLVDSFTLCETQNQENRLSIN